MGAFTSVTVIGRNSNGEGLKRVTVTAVAPASYDAGGSAIDLSAATLGADAGFTTVYGGTMLKAVHTTPASSKKYFAQVLSGASATAPIICIRDADNATAMLQGTGDLSAITLTMEFVGV